MPKGIPATSPEIRAEILRKLKEDGDSVPDLARQYGLAAKTIYKWVASNGMQPFLRTRCTSSVAGVS